MKKIICRTNYKLSLNNIDRLKCFNNKDIKYVNGLIDYFADDKKRALNMIDYFTGKINNHNETNLILENGNYATKEEIEKRKKYISKQFNNSNLWQVILSFDKKYIDSNISYRELEKMMAKEILPKFFKKMGFIETKNMCYQFSLHNNTGHPHFHISFMERKPNYDNNEGRTTYLRFGKISNDAINYLKRETILSIERNKMFRPLSQEINKEIDEFKKYFSPDCKNFILYNKRNILLEEKILNLGSRLLGEYHSPKKRVKYNSIKNKEIKQLTQEIKDELFELNIMKITKSNFNKSINDMNDYLIKITKENGMSIKDIDLSYTKYKEEYLNNYILNAIVNYSKFHYNKNENKIIDSNSFIQSVAQILYLNNKNINRKQIVHNSFNNKMLQNEIDQAIRNLNAEANEAVELFYKTNKSLQNVKF